MPSMNVPVYGVSVTTLAIFFYKVEFCRNQTRCYIDESSVGHAMSKVEEREQTPKLDPAPPTMIEVVVDRGAHSFKEAGLLHHTDLDGA
jgi:hypothetical protein